MAIVLISGSSLLPVGVSAQSLSGPPLPHDERQIRLSSRNHDSSVPSIFDPRLVYSTYLGGFFEEITWTIAVGHDGRTYVGGLTYSGNFPTTNNAFDIILGGSNDSFVTALDSTGSTPILSTYLGGSLHDLNQEAITGIALGADGSIYVAGQAASDNFPTENAIQPSFGGGSFDAFVAKLTPSGSALIFSTYFGGSGIDNAVGMALDSQENIYITGFTGSRDFPVVNAFQPQHGGGSFLGGIDAYIAKLSSDGSEVLYSSFLGGSGHDAGLGIAVTSEGCATITGSTGSTDFPTKNPLQSTHAGGVNLNNLPSDAFVTKLNASGSELIYSTYLGGRGGEHLDLFSFSARIAVDAAGNAYITGDTNSPDFPTENALQPEYGGGELDAFVAKLDEAGSELIYSTFMGGRGSDRGRGIAVASQSGHAFVSGLTGSSNFPTNNALQSVRGGNFDAFVSQLNASGSELLFSTYLGGRDFDNAIGINLDAKGHVYVTGPTASLNFPTSEDAYSTNNSGTVDAFVTKLSLDMATAIENHDDHVPETVILYHNYPNPFNPTTTIPFALKTPTNVTLTISNTRGQEVVKLLMQEPYPAGYHSVRWNSRDQNGKPLPSGIYLLQMQAGDATRTKKILLLR